MSRRSRNDDVSTAETAPEAPSEAPTPGATEATVEAAAVPPAPAETAPEAPRVYRVRAGMSLTCLKGILDGGTVAEARFFHGGQATFDHLVEAGHLVAE